MLAWIVGLHAIAVAGILVAPWPGLGLVLAMLAVNIPGALGLSLAFHRGLAHKSVAFSPRLEQGLILLAMLNASGCPAAWAAAHRLHHRYEDTERDVSSPIAGGFWWAHLRWLWQQQPVPESSYPRALRLDRYTRWQRWQPIILVIVLVLPIPLGFEAWLWLGPIRLVYILHAQALVNSVAHMGAPNRHGGSSRNVIWLGLFQFFVGENWHRNHHMNPSSARIGDAWWQVDLGWQVIRLLAWMGLATRVRRKRAGVRPSPALADQ